MLVGTLEHNAMVGNSYKQVPSESGTCSRGLASDDLHTSDRDSVDLYATDRESAPGHLTHKCAQHAETRLETRSSLLLHCNAGVPMT